MTTFKTISVPDLARLLGEVERLRTEAGLIFRGYYATPDDDPESPEALVTGLERVCRGVDDNLKLAYKREVAILREFVRRVHHYVRDVPAAGNYFEWFALMQHQRCTDTTFGLHLFTPSRAPFRLGAHTA